MAQSAGIVAARGPDKRPERRFHRQFRALKRLVPALRKPMSHLRRDSPVRFPLALVLTGSGLLRFLPLFSHWMLPAGPLLLAIDLPVLRGPISALARPDLKRPIVL